VLTTEASIDAVLARLGTVDKKGLVTVAEAFELRGVSSKAKAAIVAAIRQRIIARKGSSQRVGLLDRQAPVPGTSPEPARDQPQTQSQDGGGSST
jgi:hypothetical protein